MKIPINIKWNKKSRLAFQEGNNNNKIIFLYLDLQKSPKHSTQITCRSAHSNTSTGSHNSVHARHGTSRKLDLTMWSGGAELVSEMWLDPEHLKKNSTFVTAEQSGLSQKPVILDTKQRSDPSFSLKSSAFQCYLWRFSSNYFEPVRFENIVPVTRIPV